MCPDTACLSDLAAAHRLSPGLTAAFGIEIEVPGVVVEPFLPRGTVLLEGRGWQLETDRVPNQEVCNLEFVLAPAREMAGIERALREIIALAAKIRALGRRDPRKPVRFAKIVDGGLHSCRLRVNDFHLGGRLQTTYGIGLADIESAAERTLGSREQAARLRVVTDRVAAYHLARNCTALTPSARGLIALIHLYLLRAADVVDKVGTAHIYFRLMARSDFCSIYERLLDSAEREQVARLLLAAPGCERPGFMEAMDLDADARVFGRPYFDKEYRKNEGPKIVDWLASIVHGRGEGAWKKDLMSPPPGYLLHSGDLSRDYGMGAMGVDETSRLVLFEIRGARHRPRLVPMNGQLLHVVQREYAEAMRYNPALVPAAPLAGAAEHCLLVQCDGLYHHLRTLSQCASRVVRDRGNAQTMQHCTSVWQKCAHNLERLFEQMRAAEEVPRLAGVRAALNGIGKMLTPMRALADAADVQRLSAWLPGYRNALLELEQALWNAGTDMPTGTTYA
jgi:hypothetical protein